MELRHIIAARLRLLHRWSCHWDSDARPDTAYVGQYGELVAASWGRAHGMRVLRHNFRWGDAGEIDLVCRQGDTLVFCEVKTTTSPDSGAPARAVNRFKRQKQRSGALRWLQLLGKEVPIRFDIIEVWLAAGQKPRIRHTPGAFSLRERAH
ncbi:MAG: YraN family protein [Akkermansia sp.]|nr:YraN family protein [Akkermansia sp.]